MNSRKKHPPGCVTEKCCEIKYSRQKLLSTFEVTLVGNTIASVKKN